MSGESTLLLGRVVFESLACNFDNTHSYMRSRTSNACVIFARMQHWPSGLSVTTAQLF